MNAIELAEELDAELENYSLNYDTALDAAAMLRRQHDVLQAFHESERELMDVRDRQHEAIVKLRSALRMLNGIANAYPCSLHSKHSSVVDANQALKDTAQFDSKSQPAYTEDFQ